jgi:opacity protein-like surface antigen
MKNTLQAAALIIIAASAIGAAAVSHHKATEVNKHEWEKGYEKDSLSLNIDWISDSNFIFHLK